MTMIQKMKIIKSKFRIDSKYFSQHLGNTDSFNYWLNLTILKNTYVKKAFYVGGALHINIFQFPSMIMIPNENLIHIV